MRSSPQPVVFVSLNDVIYTQIANSLAGTDHPLIDYPADVFNLGVQMTRYVRFEIRGCPQPNGDSQSICGIGEVAFATAVAVPEPATLGLMRRRKAAA